MRPYVLLLILSSFVLLAQAKIRLPNVLSNHMVLQQQSTTKLWGWANPEEKIKIVTSWNNQVYEVITDGNANWKVAITTPVAGGPHSISLQGENTILLNDILIGEVWVCSGQSNMEWSYNLGISSVKKDFEQLAKMNIRLFNVAKRTSQSPQDDIDGTWTGLDSNTVKAFSAVGYYFGKHLQHGLQVPIGLINSSWGGTPAETWTPANQVEQDATLKRDAQLKAETKWWPVAPGYAYNAMIAPLKNFQIAGTIWYQGESNCVTPASYSQLMRTMVYAWRADWQKDFPFYYVQIAPFKYAIPYEGALVREAQTKNLQDKKMGMVVISDLVSDTLNIHPTNKEDVGLRLANMALGDTYGLPITNYSSPMVKSFTVQGNKITVTFDHADEGLQLRGKEPTALLIAGANRVFYPATIKFDKNQIIASSQKVRQPVAIRYQFSNAGIGNIFSKGGLPVAPFRTDDWELDNRVAKP